MKQFFTCIMLSSACLLTATGVFAQTTDNFNSRSEANLSQLKGYLQNQCWQFVDFDINDGGFTPGIEGDGAMVSGASANATQATGIYSQPLNFQGNVTVSFNYAFNQNVVNRRWLKVYIVDAYNNPISLQDSIELTGLLAGNVYSYSTTFSAGNNPNKIYINYQGENGSERIAIDELLFSASLEYASGCNTAPVAVADIITGSPARIANGTVITNDSDANGETLEAFLEDASPDGTVTLAGDGSFSFTPNAGFTGSSTSFTYIVCDDGCPRSCSTPVTVTLNFPPAAILPASLVDFIANYNNNAVVLNWITTFENNNDRFEIERSTDGVTFVKVGSIKGFGTTGVAHKYSFTDAVKESITNKKDLYYRLVQVDINGNTATSKVLIVRVYKTKALQMVSVTPNPSVNDIKVNVQLNDNSFVVMKVVNSIGVEILRKSARGIEGQNSFTLEGTSNLQKGIYFLEVVINSNERMQVKLIKN